MILNKILLMALLGIGIFQAEAQFKSNTSVRKSGCKKPTVTVSLKKGMPTYESKSHSELTRLCQNENLLGCTLSEYVCSYTVDLNKKGCKQLDFECYPEGFKVYILNDYPKGTCEYNAIKKHENLHVSAIQNFPKESVETYLNQCIDEEVKKKKAQTGEEIYFKCSRKTDGWMNRIKDEKNREIDRYKKYDPLYFSDCKNWKMHDWEIESHLDMKD